MLKARRGTAIGLTVGGIVVALALAAVAWSGPLSENSELATDDAVTSMTSAYIESDEGPTEPATQPWPLPETTELVMRGESARLMYDTREKLAAEAAGLATVRFLERQSVRNPTYSRHSATAEEAAASRDNPNRNPAKEPIKEGDAIGSFGTPSTIYLAQVEWASGATEKLTVSLRGGLVDGVWIDVIGQPHPRADETYVMFLRLTETGHSAIGPQFVLKAGNLEPFFDSETGVGKEFSGRPLSSLQSRFAGTQFLNGGR